MSRYSTILWDVDNTLLDFLYSQRQSLIKCFQDVGIKITEAMILRYKEINDSYWARLELGEVTKEQLLTGRFLTLFEEFDIRDVNVEDVLRLYQDNLGSIYRYMDDSLAICQSLQGKVHQYVITNGVARTQENKLRLSGLSDCMEGLFISETAGVPKPQKGFFDHCLREIGRRQPGFELRELLIVGDSLTSDIKGGIQTGIATCWYRPDDIFEKDPTVRETYLKYRPDHEISDLHQIYGILGEDL